MDLYVILATLFRCGLFALAGVAVFSVVCWGGYWIYKHIFHGTARLRVSQWIVLFLLFGWFFLVLGITTFSRGANFTGEINLSLFSGYVNAWNQWSYSEFQLIIFNMLMFSPLGFLLPYLTERGKRFSFVCLISFVTTLVIEILQFVSGRGIFELDDLFHNFIGSVFGYFISSFLVACIQKKTFAWKFFARALVLPGIYSIGFIVTLAVYHHQPFGNIPILPVQKQDMSAVSIQNDAELLEQDGKASVYQNANADNSQYSQTLRSALEELTGTQFKSSAHADGNNKLFVSKNSNTQLIIFSNNSGWVYTTWEEDTIQLDQATVKKKQQQIEAWLKKYRLLPESAVCSVQDDFILRWDVPPVDPTTCPRDFVSGSLLVQFNSQSDISSISYFVIYNKYIDLFDIQSEKEAYGKILEGNFQQYIPFEQGDLLFVENCTLDYVYDTKGFFRPVYRFSGYVNNPDQFWEASVDAMA